MSNQKITELAELAETPNAVDEFVLVDKSDTTMSADGTNKRFKFNNLHIITSEASSATPTVTGTANKNALYLTAQNANFVIQVPSGTAVRGNLAFISGKMTATLRTASVHASIADPFAKMFDEVPASGQFRVLLEYDGTEWVVLEAIATI